MAADFEHTSSHGSHPLGRQGRCLVGKHARLQGHHYWPGLGTAADGDAEHGYRLSRQRERDEQFISVPFTTDPAAIAQYLRRLNERVLPFEISNVARRLHAQSAMDWLSRIAADRETYGFYELGDHEDALQALLFVPGFEMAASEVLASLGTPAAQRQLVNFASQSDLPIEQRQGAAAAFARAVRQSGTLLTTHEIQRQYDRLDASDSQSEGSQQVLADIVSIIESRGASQ